MPGGAALAVVAGWTSVPTHSFTVEVEQAAAGAPCVITVTGTFQGVATGQNFTTTGAGQIIEGTVLFDAIAGVTSDVDPVSNVDLRVLDPAWAVNYMPRAIYVGTGAADVSTVLREDDHECLLVNVPTATELHVEPVIVRCDKAARPGISPTTATDLCWLR
jgi:hypothetical protein